MEEHDKLTEGGLLVEEVLASLRASLLFSPKSYNGDIFTGTLDMYTTYNRQQNCMLENLTCNESIHSFAHRYMKLSAF